MFGQGGTSVEILNDIAIALPPLNLKLAEDLVDRTRVSKLLYGYRNVPTADMEEIKFTLVKISQLVIENPEIAELDINPLYADSKGVIALDARIRIQASAIKGTGRLVIRPYPRELEETVKLDNGQEILLRPIRPEDEAAQHKLLNRTDPDELYFRFMKAKDNFCHSCMGSYTQIDYDREMAFIALVNNKEEETLGFIRAVSDPDNHEAEFSIVARMDRQKQDIKKILLVKMITYCKSRGTERLTGQVLVKNKAMIDVLEKCGFEITENSGQDAVTVSLNLQESG